eukprot:COSAG06_NODE_11336_length_1525_cov_3.783310_2_plen_57_part_00
MTGWTCSTGLTCARTSQLDGEDNVVQQGVLPAQSMALLNSDTVPRQVNTEQAGTPP